MGVEKGLLVTGKAARLKSMPLRAMQANPNDTVQSPTSSSQLPQPQPPCQQQLQHPAPFGEGIVEASTVLAQAQICPCLSLSACVCPSLRSALQRLLRRGLLRALSTLSCPHQPKT